LDYSLFKKRKNGNYLAACSPCNIKIAENKLKIRRERKIEDTDDPQCTACLEVKQLSEFKKIKDNYTKQCKECLSNNKKRHAKRIQSDVNDKKKCTRCCVLKNFDEFTKTKKGLRNQCNSCCDIGKVRQAKEKSQKRGELVEDKDKIRCNKCCLVKLKDDFEARKTGKPMKQCKECNSKMLLYLKNTKCDHGKINRYACKECNIGGFLKQRVSDRVRRALKSDKTKHSIEYLCCDIDKFKAHIEGKFINGMSWENYGEEWQIDHIIPIAYGNPTLDEIIQRLHYTNTQPLSVEENCKKGNRYISKMSD
jgi:hypothetical protein